MEASGQAEVVGACVRHDDLEAQSSDNGAVVAWPSMETRAEEVQGGKVCRPDQSYSDCVPKTTSPSSYQWGSLASG